MQYEHLSPNAISYYKSPSNLGGYWSLRLFYSADIVQQPLQTDTELDGPVKFKYSERIINTWLPKQFVLEPSMGVSFDENGFSETHDIKLIIDANGMEDIFKKWFRKYLQGKRLCLELTTMNKVVTLYNPMMATYNYVAASDFGGTATYEIYFSRAKYVEYEFKAIQDVQKAGGRKYRPTAGGEQPLSKISILLNTGVSLDYVQLRIGTTSNIEKSKPCNLVLNKPDGQYWIFAVCKADDSILQIIPITLDSAATPDLVLR